MTLRSLVLTILVFAFGDVFGQPAIDPGLWYNKYLKDYGLSQKEYTAQYNYLDFAPLFLKTPSKYIYGVIGKGMQRLQLKWLSIKKDKTNPNIYIVAGKTRVSSNIVEFNGQLEIKSIRLFPPGRYDMPSGSKVNPNSIGILFCDFSLHEDRTQNHSGTFKGISATQFYIDKNHLYYNDLRAGADDMTNNEFVGTWTSYSNGKTLNCSWGDYRVPNITGDFDCGGAEFAPCDRYVRSGWEDFYQDRNPKTKEVEWWTN
jgi:hypothetical protein